VALLAFVAAIPWRPNVDDKPKPGAWDVLIAETKAKDAQDNIRVARVEGVEQPRGTARPTERAKVLYVVMGSTSLPNRTAYMKQHWAKPELGVIFFDENSPNAECRKHAFDPKSGAAQPKTIGYSCVSNPRHGIC
jgi:hypothetical protein